MTERYALMTIDDLARHILSKTNLDDVKNTEFTRCAFAIPEEIKDRNLEEIAMSNTGWYGITTVDAGFDSCDLCLIADYYGGGCAHFASMYDGVTYTTAYGILAHLILNVLRTQETFERDVKLIVDFEDDNPK